MKRHLRYIQYYQVGKKSNIQTDTVFSHVCKGKRVCMCVCICLEYFWKVI